MEHSQKCVAHAQSRQQNGNNDLIQTFCNLSLDDSTEELSLTDEEYGRLLIAYDIEAVRNELIQNLSDNRDSFKFLVRLTPTIFALKHWKHNHAHRSGMFKNSDFKE